MMSSTDTGEVLGKRPPVSVLLILFVILPILLHLAGISWYVLTTDQIKVTSIDVVINSLAVVYLVTGFLLLRINPSLALRFGVAAWSLILSLTLVEMVIFLGSPERPDKAPWPPTKQVSTAADTMPGISGRIVLTVNPNLGLRAPNEGFKSADLRVLCLGGSTTECLYVTDNKTWPRLLQEKLSHRLGLGIFVGNGGRSGHFTLHTIEKIKHYSAFDRFDLILIMNGINDMGTLLLDNYEKREEAVPEEALLKNPLSVAGDHPYYASSRLVSALLYAKSIRDLNQEATENPNAVSQDEAGAWYTGAREARRNTLQTVPRDSLPPNMSAALDRYRVNLKKIIELCRDKGKPVVFVTQPTIYENQMPQENRDLLLGGVNRELGFAYTERVLDRVMTAYNDVLLDTCAKQGVECIDLARLLPKDTSIFYDDCHFNISGCEKVATILADRLSNRLGP